MRRYLTEHGVAHRMVGKIIVAADPAEEQQLDVIFKKGRENGVEGLSRLDAAEVVRLEPSIRCSAALHSATTGILDTHAYMTALLGDARTPAPSWP